MASESNSQTGSERTEMFRGLRDAETRVVAQTFGEIAKSIAPKYHFKPITGAEAANAAAGPLELERCSTDIWATARALNVLCESLFAENPVTRKALEDAARYLGEFGEIRSRAEQLARLEDRERFADRRAEGVRQGIFSSDIYREGERVIRKREADKLRTETRKTSKKAVKRG